MNIQKFFAGSVMIAAVLVSNVTAQAQNLGNIINSVKGGNSTNNNKSNLSNTDIVSGLKEALNVGAKNAANQLSVKDGFFKNAAIKILLPQEVQQVESALRKAGLGNLVDDAIVKMNRAAEDASKKAAPIFVNAITSITINDGLSILTGANNAATTYLQSKTTNSLTQAFRPSIETSLNKVGAVTAWKKVFDAYNRIPLVNKKINSDLTGYVTERALSGLFATIAQEELKIRTNPAAQVSNILKKVFGNG